MSIQLYTEIGGQQYADQWTAEYIGVLGVFTGEIAIMGEMTSEGRTPLRRDRRKDW